MKSVSSRTLMRHIISLLYLLICSVAWGSALSTQQIQSEFGEFSSIQSLSAQFKQVRTMKEWQTEILTEGQMSLSKKPHSVVTWEVDKPTYSGILLKEGSLFVRTQKQKEWQKLKNKKVKKTMARVFTWLRFDIEQIKKDFHIYKEKAGHFYFLPKNKSAHFKKISLFFTQAPLLDKIVLQEANDDSLSIEFVNPKVKK